MAEMLEQLKTELVALWQEMKPRLRRGAVHALVVLRAAWAAVRPALLFALQVVAALIVLFEEWGWRPLMEALGQFARFRPIAALERWIAGLPPYGALVVFALPTTILLPLKFVAVWLLANGFVWSAGGLFLGAKVASTALIARIFMLTKPALMQLAWFARAYNWFMPWKEALFAEIRASWPWRYGRMVKNRTRLEVKQAWARWKPSIDRSMAYWKPWLAAKIANARRRLRIVAAEWRPKLRNAADRARQALRNLFNRPSGNAL